MSKEEILDGYEYQKIKIEHDDNDYHVDMWERGDVYKAMDEYAKQQSIEFNKWFRPFKNAELEKCRGNVSEWVRVAQLPDEHFYDIFLQSKQPT